MKALKETCKYFGSCGGCSFPQDFYEQSLNIKEQALLNLFSPLLTNNTICYPAIPCKEGDTLRNKMEFSFFQTFEGEKNLGLMSSDKPKRTIPIDSCILSSPSMLEILDSVRYWWDQNPSLMAYYPPKNKGTLSSLTIRYGNVNNDFMVILSTSGRPEYAIDEHLLKSFVDGIKNSVPQITSIYWEEKIAKPKTPTVYRLSLLYGNLSIRQSLSPSSYKKSSEFIIYPKSFFQPNSIQANHILNTTKQFLNPKGDEFILDLYCGGGTIGIVLAPYVKTVWGVDNVPENIQSAHENIVLNNVENNTTVYLEDAKNFCKTHPNIVPDVVIVDPPRCGLQNKALKYLLQINPPKIIYISCNPKSQFIDCEVLIQSGYQIKNLQPIDQFPFSSHIENIILLEKELS